TVRGSTITHNIAGPGVNFSSGSGGGIYSSAGTVTVSACTVAGNTASSAGGGIYNRSGFPSALPPLTITANNPPADNQARAGAALERLGTLIISHSAAAAIDNQNAAATTITVTSSDTATALTTSPNPSASGQAVVLSAHVVFASPRSDGTGQPVTAT